MMSLQLAVATEDFGAPLKAAIAEASKCRVQGLRLNARTEVRSEDFSDTALRQLRHFVSERQLRVAGLMFSTRHALQAPEHLDRRIDGIRAAMTMVRKLGTSELLVRCGRIPAPDDTPATGSLSEGTGAGGSDQGPSASRRAPTNEDVDSLINPFSFAPSRPSVPSEPSSAQQFALLCDVLNDLVRHGNHVGCVLQLLLSDFDTDRVTRLIDDVKAGPLGLVFDPATAVMSGQSPVRVFRSLHSHVTYVRARDARKDIDGGGIEAALGDGTVDWTELLPLLAEAEYGGWICVERTGGDQRATDATEGVARLRKLLMLET